MLGAIAGDIIGRPWEIMGEKNYDFPLFTEHSRFTDDTVMTVAIAQALLESSDYAKAMRRFGKRYPAIGYGRRFEEWLLDESMGPYNSYGNGGAMRASPIGYTARSIEEALTEAERCAVPTHNHPEGVKGAQAIALAVFLARTGASKLQIRNDIIAHIGYDLDRTVAQIRPSYCFDIMAARSVPEAIICFLDAENFEAAVRNAVSLGGDTDTMACMAGAIAEAYWGDVPAAIADEVRSRLPDEFVGVVDQFYERYPRAMRITENRDSIKSDFQSRLPEVISTGESPPGALKNAGQYRQLADRFTRQLRAEPNAVALVRELEAVLRYEIENAIPLDMRLSSRLSPRPRVRRTALISDIHGSHTGLLAALADIENQHCDRILCLGDLVEGGAGNEQVIETLRSLQVPCVRGNHDETNDVQLDSASRQFLQGLPEHIAEDDVLYTHISPRRRKRKISYAVEAWNVFDEVDFRLLFIGHVHVPMIFGMRSESFGEAAIHAFEYNRPCILARDERYIISIGAIAYGRDNVGKIRYAIHDAEANTVELRAIDGPLLPMDYTLRGTTVETL